MSLAWTRRMWAVWGPFGMGGGMVAVAGTRPVVNGAAGGS